MTVQMISTPSGDRLAVSSADEYEDLLITRRLDARMDAIVAGRAETLAGEEVDAYLDAASPLAFWRERRGLSPEMLAQAAHVAPEELARLETGASIGDIRAYAHLAERLDIRIEDIVPEKQFSAAR